MKEGSLRTFGSTPKTDADKPIVTIITPVYNGEATIEQTIKSVLMQTYPNIEYVIIDGGSTDTTLEKIELYSGSISYWRSEPDEGIYDAINKGIAISSGEIIGILHSDDFFISPTVIEEVVSYSRAKKSVATIAYMLDGNSRARFTQSSRFGLYLQLPYMHPAVFVTRKDYHSVGRYDTRYRIASDCDFLLRRIKMLGRIERAEIDSVVLRTGGLSQKKYLAGRVEYALIYFRLFQAPIKAVYGFVLSVVYHMASLMRGRRL